MSIYALKNVAQGLLQPKGHYNVCNFQHAPGAWCPTFHVFSRNSIDAAIMLIISPDGYIRLSLDAMRGIGLVHLISGLDEDMPLFAEAGAVPTTISGYTEWISEDSAPLTIGWDWQLNVDGKQVRMERISEPRSNIMLIDAAQADVGPQQTDILLGGVIDALAWQDTTLQFVQQKRA
jgi:hypothetical protein